MDNRKDTKFCFTVGQSIASIKYYIVAIILCLYIFNYYVCINIFLLLFTRRLVLTVWFDCGDIKHSFDNTKDMLKSIKLLRIDILRWFGRIIVDWQIAR
jgi:hypothetical protein